MVKSKIETYAEGLGMITAITVLVALIVLGWGFYRARPFGKLGILAWLQSVVLMAPWLLAFGFSIAGIYLNLIIVILLFVASTGLYIYLGRRVRSLSEDASLAQRATTLAQSSAASPVISGEASPPPPLLPVDGMEPEVIPIPKEDLQAIQGIFGIDTFFATETIPFQEGVVFRGNLRGEIEPTYTKLTANLQARVSDRYRLFFVEGQDKRPTCIVLPSSSDPKPSTVTQNIIAVVLILVTFAASLESAGIMLGFDFFTTPTRFTEVLPIALGIISILAAHEVGHWVLAQRYQVRLSLPFFIPTWQLGSFGAITRFESVLKNRTVLFDIALAGPAAGGLLSLVLLILGLVLSHKGSTFQVPTEFFQGSILVGTLARVVLRESLQEAIVDVSPLVILGWLGLIVTALNLLPAGQLDGGRMVQAVYGRTIANRTTIAALIILGLASLVNPLALYWAIVVLFLQRELERPCLNDLSEPDDARAGLVLLALFLMIVTLLPLTPSLAGRLGIGA
jgi:membrane-associated protease RseP (regulator of RpoE activity)